MSLSTADAAGVTATSITSTINSHDSSNTPSTDKATLAPLAVTPSRSNCSNPSSACTSGHPSPNGTLTKPPSLDVTTPRSIKLYDLEDHVASTLMNSRDQEPTDSPFFAGWDTKDSKGSGTPSTGSIVLQSTDPFYTNEQKRYSFGSLAG